MLEDNLKVSFPVVNAPGATGATGMTKLLVAFEVVNLRNPQAANFMRLLDNDSLDLSGFWGDTTSQTSLRSV